MPSSMRSLVAVLVFVLSTFALFIVVLALLPADSRQEEFDRLISVLPAIAAGIPGVLAFLRAKDAADTSQANSEALNGGLDARMVDAARTALAEHSSTE